MKKWLLISVLLVAVLSYNNVFAAQSEEEVVGTSNYGYYEGGQFYEEITKQLVYEEEDDLYVEYMIRYYIVHDGNGGYTYQSGAVNLYVDGEYITTFDDELNEKIVDERRLCGEIKVTLTKGEEHKIEIKDTVATASTTINVEGIIFHGIPSYEVSFYDGFDNVIETQYILRNNAAVEPTVPSVEGYIFNGWDSDFSKVTKELTINATWLNAPKIVVYDQYFTTDEEVTISDITSNVYGIDEFSIEQTSIIEFKGLENISFNEENEVEIEATYTTSLGNKASDRFVVYIVNISDDNLIRQISLDHISTISDSSIWIDKIQQLSSIIDNEDAIDVMKATQE